jgi:Transposase IS116/IS110/IS902 family
VQRDAAILASLPGNGRIVLATLLAEGWEALRRRDYHALRTLCGTAPVTKRSGKSCIVTRRLACNPRLQNALYHWARVAVQHAAAPSTPLCACAVTATPVPSARSAIGCLMSPARCFATAPNLTPHWRAKKCLLKGRKSPRAMTVVGDVLHGRPRLVEVRCRTRQPTQAGIATRDYCCQRWRSLVCDRGCHSAHRHHLRRARKLARQCRRSLAALGPLADRGTPHRQLCRGGARAVQA